MNTDDEIRMVIRECVFIELSLRRVFNHPNYKSKINEVMRDYLDSRIRYILIREKQEINNRNKSFFGGN